MIASVSLTASRVTVTAYQEDWRLNFFWLRGIKHQSKQNMQQMTSADSIFKIYLFFAGALGLRLIRIIESLIFYAGHFMIFYLKQIHNRDTFV